MVKPITRAEYKKLDKRVNEALRLASTHDPDLLSRIEVLERQMERIGAPQYRLVRSGKRAEIRRGIHRKYYPVDYQIPK